MPIYAINDVTITKKFFNLGIFLFCFKYHSMIELYMITSQHNQLMFCLHLICAQNNERKSNIDKSPDICLVVLKHLENVKYFKIEHVVHHNAHKSNRTQS